ncbi:hypothetical protein DVH24_005389 [Malus domestica]|uniref:NAC domain-containing protein n=1 Tax=Malus domestica TaxID=3750 RepID=A0A498KJL7_MALDO|nr:hypothetical protein DVH24_005389 [Malus domestica]
MFRSFSNLQLKTTTFLKKALIVKLSCSSIRRRSFNSTRCNRATDQGFYKITGKKCEIRAEESKAVIGKKRILTFYEGRVPKAKKTDWVVHEYYLTKIEVGSRSTKQTTSRTGMSSASSSAAPTSEKEPTPPTSATSSASLTSPPAILSTTSWLPPAPSLFSLWRL